MTTDTTTGLRAELIAQLDSEPYLTSEECADAALAIVAPKLAELQEWTAELAAKVTALRDMHRKAEAEVARLRTKLAEEVQVTAQAEKRAEFSEGEHQVTRERLEQVRRELAAARSGSK